MRPPAQARRRSIAPGDPVDQRAAHLRDDGPGGPPAAGIGAALKRAPFFRDRDKQEHRLRDRLAVGAGEQDADVIGQQFARMNERGRYDRAAQRDGICQRARGDLLKIGVGGEIDVAEFDLVEQFAGIEEAIFPGDIIRDAEALGEPFEALPIGFPLGGDQVGMSRADDPVENIGILGGDRRQGPDRRFEAFPRPDETEGRENRSVGDSQCLAQRRDIDEGAIGRAVLDMDDLVAARSVDVAQDFAAEIAHHHKLACAGDQSFHDPALVGVGLGEHRVKRHDQRRGNPIDQLEDHVAGDAAENAELMLKPYRARAAVVDLLGGRAIAGGLLLADRARHFGAKRPIAFAAHRIDVDGEIGPDRAQMIMDVGGKGRDAASTRPETADQGHARGRIDTAGGKRKIRGGNIVFANIPEKTVFAVVLHIRPRGWCSLARARLPPRSRMRAKKTPAARPGSGTG